MFSLLSVERPSIPSSRIVHNQGDIMRSNVSSDAGWTINTLLATPDEVFSGRDPT